MIAWQSLLMSLLFWVVVCGTLGLTLLLGGRGRHWLGGLLSAAALIMLGIYLPWMGGWVQQIVFWILAGIAALAAIGMVAARSPVYSALWFALVLLAVAGIFLLLGAQFLGIATVVVYAGAIVVTFLFVLMLAQPEGEAFYDRVSWGWFPIVSSSLTAMLIVAGVAYTLSDLPAPWSWQVVADQAPPEAESVRAPQHMATLGGQLFTRHLVSVEIAGTLLLVALVGAIAIVLHGRQQEQEQPPAVREGRFWNE